MTPKLTTNDINTPQNHDYKHKCIKIDLNKKPHPLVWTGLFVLQL